MIEIVLKVGGGEAAHLVEQIPEEVLRELGLVRVEDGREEAVENGLPGSLQLPLACPRAQVLKHEEHHAVQLLRSLVNLQGHMNAPFLQNMRGKTCL